MNGEANPFSTFWKKYQSLRLVAFSCHEAALRALDAWAGRVQSGTRVHLYEYFLEHPSPASPPQPTPNFFVPFVDHEVASRGLCLALPDSPEEEDAFLQELISIVRRGRQAPVVLPIGFSAHLDPSVTIQRLCRLGPITTGNLSRQLYRLWKQDRSVDAKDRFVNRTQCLREMETKLTDDSLETRFRLGWANIFTILYTPLVTRADTRDRLLSIIVPLASPLAFYGVLAAMIEVPTRTRARNSSGITNELIGLAKEELIGLAETVYLPTLILTQNCFEEIRSLSLSHSGCTPQ